MAAQDVIYMKIFIAGLLVHFISVKLGPSLQSDF